MNHGAEREARIQVGNAFLINGQFVSHDTFAGSVRLPGEVRNTGSPAAKWFSA
jgi:hypothetical protein